MRLAPALASALVATALAGCGGGDDEDARGPSTLVPAGALVYGEAQLRPEGDQRTAIEAPLAALLDTEDPGAVVVEELDRELAEAGDGMSYADDIEPWLGERGAFFFTSLFPAGEGPQGAFVLESADPEAARRFADELAAQEDDAEEATYEGTAYARGADGNAVGVVGDAVVLGSEPAFEAVVETRAGGDSLAEEPEFAQSVGDDAGAAAIYADPAAIIAAAEDAGELGRGDRRALGAVLAGFVDEPLAAVLRAETTGLGLEVSHGAGEAPVGPGAGEAALLRELPEDSWLAAGLADAGEVVGRLVGSADDLGVAGGELDAALRSLRRELGLELERLYGPLGDAALFASGAGIFGAGGGAVFEAEDAAAATELVSALERAARRGGERVRRLTGPGVEAGFALDVPDAPGAVNFVAGRDRVVIAYGEAATVAVLDPENAARTLADSERFAEAESALGDEYEVGSFVDFGPLVDLLGLAAATDPSLQGALPYLEALDFLVAGSSSGGERARHRLYLGISGIVTEPDA